MLITCIDRLDFYTCLSEQLHLVFLPAVIRFRMMSVSIQAGQLLGMIEHSIPILSLLPYTAKTSPSPLPLYFELP